MAATLAKKYSYEDYAKLPEGAPYELIGGELVEEPAPIPVHQRISRRIGTELIRFVEEHELGEVFYAPVDVHLSDEETYQPDILFISNDRLGIIGVVKIEGAPDLVIEILSPSTAYYDLRHKKQVYEESGVQEYWIVDPIEKCIEIYRNGDGFLLAEQKRNEGSIVSRLLPGFASELSSVFG
jgi:Uma2 family endonuclease